MAKNDDLFGFDEEFDLNAGSSSDFDFDTAFGDSNDSNSSLGSDDDDGFGDLGNADAHNRKATNKTALIAILCGIILIAVVFGVVNFINKRSEDKVNNPNVSTELPAPNTDSGKSPQPSTPSTPSTGVNTPSVQSNPNQPSESSKPVQSNDGWIEIPVYDGITWNSEKIDSTFYITSKKHYIKVIDSSNFEIKTVLYGALSGFTGTYDLEVPYTVGTHKDLPVGESFKVKVQFGTDTTGKTVVGEIEL